MAVANTATSTGKKMQKTGKRRVPNPNPEKKVSTLPTKTTRGIIAISNSKYLSENTGFVKTNK
jgi:hypothetical protein